MVWNTASWQPRYSHREPVGFGKAAFSPDGKTLALSRFAPETKLFDAKTGKLLKQLEGHTNHARCVTFTPDGQQIITGSYDRTIKVWNAATGEVIATLEGATHPVYHVALSPDGTQLAAAEAPGRRVSLWDLKTRKQIHVFDDLGSLVPQVAFSPDGRLLAAASWSGHLHLIDVKSHEKWLGLHPGGGVHWAEYSPKQNWLAVVTNGRTVYVFPANTDLDKETEQKVDALLAKFEDDSYAVREQASKDLAAIGPAAETKLSEAMRSPSAEVRIRARELRRRLTKADGAVKLSGHLAELQCVTFSPDGKLLASGDKDGRIIVWSVGDWKKLVLLNVAMDEHSQ